MAEALLRHALPAEDEPLKSLNVISAGIAADNGNGPSDNTIRAMERVNIDVSEHKSQMLTQEIIDKSYAIFCMTHSHIAIIDAMFGDSIENLFLMREHLAQEKNMGEEFSDSIDYDFRSIPDPIGLPLSSYLSSRDHMVEGIPPIIKWLKANYTLGA